MNNSNFNEKLSLWQKEVDKVITKRQERKKNFNTISNVPIKRLYCPKQNYKNNYSESIGFPGLYPFTRGIRPTMYRGQFWTMRQYAGFSSAIESNLRYRYLLDQGQTGLSIAFDLPTQLGYDADHNLSIGEVGKVGVSISSLKDMEILFKNIPLDKVSTSMTINAPAGILLAMYLVVAIKQNVPIKLLRGTIQNDILKEYSSRGTYIFPPKQSMRIITNIFEFCSNELPLWNSISISGYHIREAGSTAIQEVAFTIANGLAYINAALNVGLDIDTFAPRLSFFFNAHSDFLEEIAKYRAARRLWAKLIKDRFNAKNPQSYMMRFHTQTAGCSLTAQQPNNNIVRVAFQAMCAVLGGTQSLHTNSLDEAFSLPSEEAVTIALRTQQIIAHETGVTETIDPLGGSYYIEELTDKIEKKAFDYINKIDEIGGAVEAVEKGYIQREIHNSSYAYQKLIESNERIIVGVNKFNTQNETHQDILRVDKILCKEQIVALNKIRTSRNNDIVKSELHKLKDAAKRSDKNLIPYFIKCVECYTTLGEICDVLRDVFGEYRSPNVI